jgi:predicted peptidase
MRQLLAGLLALFAMTCTRESRFLERAVAVGDKEYRYRVWLPPHYTKLHHWPVVLYLHGIGERGDDDTKQLAVGLPVALEKDPQRWKCIVVIPQCEEGQEWYGEMEAYALAALDATVHEFHGDVRRRYLTGNSMGGAGTWYMARHRKRWAAVVPVCGEVARPPDDPFPNDPPAELARIVGSKDPYGTLADQIGTLPVWAFHGANDKVIPPTESRSMVEALRSRGGRVLYTEYPTAGHDAWTPAYSEPALVGWMLRQRSGK